MSEATENHSGYDFSWSPFKMIPFMVSTTYHDFHHSNNLGNYASHFIIWDYIFGDNKPYYEYMKRMKELKQTTTTKIKDKT